MPAKSIFRWFIQRDPQEPTRKRWRSNYVECPSQGGAGNALRFSVENNRPSRFILRAHHPKDTPDYAGSQLGVYGRFEDADSNAEDYCVRGWSMAEFMHGMSWKTPKKKR